MSDSVSNDKGIRLPRARILVVDDVPANLMVLQTILEPLNQEIVSAATGEEALQLLANDEFAVVLLDVFLPGIDGFETAARLRESVRARHTPVIFLTACEIDAQLTERGYSLGAVDFLMKPFSQVALRAKVGGFVDLYHEKVRARRESEQFKRLVESTKDYAIFLLNPDGLVATWNPGAERFKQYSSPEIVGRHFSCFYPQEAIDRGWPDYELQTARELGRFEDEGWRIRKDGSRFWASVVITALYDHGQLVGFSKITRDMTERMEAEASLRTARDQLELRVSERTLQLANANRSLREADSRKDEFLAMLAHELRNPLATIRNSLQILGIDGIQPNVILQTSQMMDRQVFQLVRLVDDLMDVSRVMRGKIELRREPTEVALVLNRAVETVQPLINERGHELSLQLPRHSLLVDVDPVRIIQVFANLVTNAAKYSQPNGQIAIDVCEQKGNAVIAVNDTGIGMPPDLIPHVFTLFVQGNHEDRISQGGLGIGLTLVRNLVEMHGGSIHAASEGPNRGSTFTVTLPLARDSEHDRSSKPSNQASSLPLPTHRLLVVDDNQDAANSLAVLLRLYGHEVRVVYDGHAAIKQARDYSPEMIFLDIGMPVMDGYEVAKQLKSDPGTQSAVLTALTGWGQKEDRRRSADAGFDHHLTKPPDINQIAEVISKLNLVQPT